MSSVQLDKSFKGTVSSHGTIRLRVVVLKPKAASTDGKEPKPDELGSAGDEPIESGASPLAAYLERHAHGRQCIVFLINGQRHEAWDNTFIARDLGFKYLRTRTVIVVDLDGLNLEAITEIVQGSRQGLYAGNVMAAITDRMVATLKKDPDLTRLQTEAEHEISELQAGDEVVRKKLDELIDAHHTAATHFSVGTIEPGPKASDQAVQFGKDKKQNVVIGAAPDLGEAGTPPVLVTLPAGSLIRLRPDVRRIIAIKAQPEPEWAKLEAFEVRTDPKIDELGISVRRGTTGAEVELLFSEPPGFDTDEYPIETTLSAFAKFKGHSELRLVEREIIINRGYRPPKPKPVLTVNPTFLRVVSRQPIKLIPGGPSAHVRMRWDGHDSLTAGTSPPWKLQARCLSLGTFPPIGFTEPKDGAFELLLDTPRGLLPKQQLKFEIEALGPAGKRLVETFVGEVVEIPATPEPRRVSVQAPEATAQRRPPYDLKYVKEADWGTPTCWDESTWTKDDAGAFTEPTESTPLTLIINEDAEGLKLFREALVKRNLDEATVKERVTRYSTHIAFHLYQLHQFVREQREARQSDESIHEPTDDELRLEIGRVAATLVKIMEVSR
jgi:hypothetical protein